VILSIKISPTCPDEAFGRPRGANLDQIEVIEFTVFIGIEGQIVKSNNDHIMPYLTIWALL
jgi:hypothetical protein